MPRIARVTTGAGMALTASFTLVAAEAGAQGAPPPAPPGGTFAPQGGPAVSAPNYKVQFGGGSVDGTNGDEGTFDFRTSFTAPLSYSTGYQVDGIVDSIGGDVWGMVAGHWFWRDPVLGLSGAYAEFNTYDGVDWGTLAWEGEIYMGRLTFSTATGVQFGDVDTAFFTETTGKFYFTDDFFLQAGYRHDSAGSYGITRIEAQIAPALSGLTLFADGNWNEDGFDSVIGGVKFYFGEPKSLIRRHREDDPVEHGNVASGAKKAGEPKPVVKKKQNADAEPKKE